ncbi:two-component sensor histidine kinase [Planotetraspora silvatica]|uniref:histidine kinase n=1 Tax=Planotetraspora silvatica TaxID=234614 RepID=A0A8J3UQE8_9ACTN|nr:ATP-binding protein [Planotetraspora silvatica]GII49989.1 two-component sensor histidine kinase [Planotetraspora silvatica]
MLRPLLPRSIRARFTLMAGVVSLIVISLIGAGLDFAIRHSIETHIFNESQRVATNLIGWRPGNPLLTPETKINLLQIVDSHRRVLAGSPGAGVQHTLSTMRPPLSDRVSHDTECFPHHGCDLVTAFRIPPLETSLIWQGDPHFVYAGMAQPGILVRDHLEIDTTVALVLLIALAVWGIWWGVGRTLRPVHAISARMAEITVSDLSLRVPEPPGGDEIAHLARSANGTLARLEECLVSQRHFASVVSHELRNPVAGLHTQLEEALLYRDTVDPWVTIETSLCTTERFRMIIDDVLLLARVRTTNPAAPEPIDLGALVREEAADRTYGVPVRAHTQGEVMVLGNRIQLCGVLNNLLFNAKRHAETIVEVTATCCDGQAVVTVTDDGDGIAPDDRERVFEPFVRLDNARRRDPGGSGLGLSIARAISNVHHGSLQIEDSLRGARFVLRLPLMDAAQAPPASMIPNLWGDVPLIRDITKARASEQQPATKPDDTSN